MNIFFTSDTHFDHDNVRIFCNRPFKTVADMNEAMVERWNKLVKPEDMVYILGDFAWKRHMHWANALNGSKVLIIGNHDSMPHIAIKQFTGVVGECGRKPGILQTTIDGQYVVMCHYPMYSWNGSFHGSWALYGHCHGRKREFDLNHPITITQEAAVEDNYDPLPPARQPEYMDGLACAVDADVWDYTPVPWEVIKAKLTARIPAWKARREAHQNKPCYDYPSQLSAENLAWRKRVEYLTHETRIDCTQ